MLGSKRKRKEVRKKTQLDSRKLDGRADPPPPPPKKKKWRKVRETKIWKISLNILIQRVRAAWRERKERREEENYRDRAWKMQEYG